METKILFGVSLVFGALSALAAVGLASVIVWAVETFFAIRLP